MTHNFFFHASHIHVYILIVLVHVDVLFYNHVAVMVVQPSGVGLVVVPHHNIMLIVYDSPVMFIVVVFYTVSDNQGCIPGL